MVRMIATKSQSYKGRSIGTGETFEASRRDAVLLQLAKRARIASSGAGVPAAVETAAPAGEGGTVEPEGSADQPLLDMPVQAPQPDPPLEDEKPAGKKRTYRRRDLRAEDSSA